MTAPPRRPFLRRVCLWTGTAVLLVAGYFSSYFTVLWLAGHGSISNTNPIGWIYAPLFVYQCSDLPGSDELHSVAFWCLNNGEMPLDECRDRATRSKAFMRRHALRS